MADKLRTLLDAVDLSALPRNPPLILGYVDGRDTSQHAKAARKRFPFARIITVTVTGATPGAVICDRENGDASAVTAARWAHNEHGSGRHPTVYTYLAGVAEVLHELHQVRLGPADVSIFTAHYTGRRHICGAACLRQYGPLAFTPQVVATQYESPSRPGAKVRYDVSAVAAHWPGVDPEPVPGEPRALSRPALLLVRRLTNALGRYHRGITQNRADLEALGREVTRVLGLKP